MKIEQEFEASKQLELEKQTQKYKKFKVLNDLPTCKEDAKRLYEFCLFFLNVPVDNIKLMCSEADYDYITDISFWDE